MSKKNICVYDAFTGRSLQVKIPSDIANSEEFWNILNDNCIDRFKSRRDRAFDSSGKRIAPEALCNLENNSKIWAGSGVDFRYQDMLRRNNNEEYLTCKIVIIGPPAVGKSATTFQFVNSQFLAEHDPTLEDTYNTEKTIDGIIVEVSIMDTAGQEQFGAEVDQWIDNADIILIQFDVSLSHTWDMVRRNYNGELKQKLIEDDSPVDKILICVGNKCDLEHQVQEHTVRQDVVGWQDTELFYISAKENTNVQDAFVHGIRKHLYNAMKNIKKPENNCCTIL